MTDKDKIKPIEERIAEMFGKTTYRDFNEGFGGTRKGLNAMDVADALGRIQTEFGTLIPLAMETRYAMTLRHERELCTGWEEFGKLADPRMDRDTKSFSRFACALAVRELAGARHSASDMAHYAWIMCVRRQALDAAVWLVGSWLDEMCETGKHALRPLFRDAA